MPLIRSGQSTFLLRVAAVVVACCVVVVCPAICSTAAAAAPEKPASPSPVPTLAFLRAHCAACHADGGDEGGFRIETLAAQPATADDDLRWGRVVARLEAGEMPPPDEAQPSPADVRRVLVEVKDRLAASARARRGEGRVQFRRLNRLEYENTVHDLLGVHLPLRDMLPEDDAADGFNTASSALAISPVHIQRYMDVAEARNKLEPPMDADERR